MSSVYVFPPVFEGLPVMALFTTRAVFSPPSETVRELGAGSLYMPIQKHTDIIINADSTSEPTIGDAVVTSRRGLAVGIQTADCVPVLLFDPKQEVVAAVHAGWRGTGIEILSKTIFYMKSAFGTYASDLWVAIGPSIGVCCYEVGGEVADAVRQATGSDEHETERHGRTYVDLAAANRTQALREGVQADRLWMSRDCTKCLPGQYHSYRSSGVQAGRQYGLIALR